MDYKNMSTEELNQEYRKWTPNPADAVPVQNMYHEQQIQMLKALTSEQRQAMIDHERQKYDQAVSETKTFAYGAAGLFFLFIAWACLAA